VSVLAGALVVAGSISAIVGVTALEPIPFLAGFCAVVIGAAIEAARTNG
jgi:hypothetical protein